MNEDRMTVLIDALSSEDHNERVRALMALGTERSHAAADAIVAHLGTETDCQVREMTTWAAVQNRELTTPGVLGLLASESAPVRMQAAHVLSKIGDPAHAASLIPLIADADPQVAVKAYRAAANTGDTAVIEPLIARLGEGDAEQRDALTRAFGVLGEPAVAPLTAALAGGRDVQLNALDALAEIGSPDADAALGAIASLTKDADADVRLAAVSALGTFDREGSEAHLRAAAASDDSVVQAVATRLVR